MNNIIEQYIQKKIPYDDIPKQIQNSELTRREYEKLILSYSISNQLEFEGNLVQSIIDKDIKLSVKKYHEELIKYSKENLMLYPYHLSVYIAKGLEITPFQYYYHMLESIMESERSYDSLPNFTAADCLRLIGIGRNEYIELMNKFRSSSKYFRRKNIKSLLPNKPIEINVEPWWYVGDCGLFDEEIKMVSEEEKKLIDSIIDTNLCTKRAGDLDYKAITSLYTKGFIYLEVPIHENDHVVLPPLEGFVMNRVLGDSIENLLYKIFVSIDERTSVGELASVLQIDLQLVKNVVSLYCRLGFAIKKVPEFTDLHPSWKNRVPVKSKKTISMSNVSPRTNPVDPNNTSSDTKSTIHPVSTPSEEYSGPLACSPSKGKRIAFLFDSTLTAFLMMGNLSPGLRSHAVTMFEVGKLSDESIESFLTELEKVSTVRDDSEGEAKRYFEHALILRETILALRHHISNCSPLDLVRCESLESLDKETASRLLNKNYSLLVSMAPLCKEVTPIISIDPPHLGPAHSEINTFWFKLFLYYIMGTGPPSVLFVKGTRVRRLPQYLHNCCKLLVTSWGHDPMVVPIHNCLFTINDALLYAPVLVQAYGWKDDPQVKIIPFPCKDQGHPIVAKLGEEIDLVHTCGYITLLKYSDEESKPRNFQLAAPVSSKVERETAKPEKSTISQEPIPSNGLLSEENATLLREEIDHLIDSCDSKDCAKSPDHSKSQDHSKSPDHSKSQDHAKSPADHAKSQDHAKSPADHAKSQNHSKSQDHSKNQDHVKSENHTAPKNFVKPSSSIVPEVPNNGWVLIECCFGVPLFDHAMNKHICETIVSDNLWGKESLDELTKSNKILCNRLTLFINEFQDYTLKSSLCNKLKQDKEITSWPMNSIMFYEGKISDWNGKYYWPNSCVMEQ